MKDLQRRLEALEDPIIDDLADFVRWQAEGCPPWRWDLGFRDQMDAVLEALMTRSKDR